MRVNYKARYIFCRLLWAVWLSIFHITSSVYGQHPTEPGLVYHSYSQQEFDSDSCCWRKLNAEKKYVEAGLQIEDFIRHGNPSNKHSLHWHAGQMYAKAELNDKAKRYFRKTRSVFYKWFGDMDAKAWYYYVKGCISFLDQDQHSMDRTLSKFEHKFPLHTNYKALLQLKANWHDSYAKATKE